MNTHSKVDTIDEILLFLLDSIEKYHTDYNGKPEMRGFTGEKYFNHLNRVAERSEVCFKDPKYQKKAKATGFGHDLLEKFINEPSEFRSCFIEALETYDEDGHEISQAMQLVDFKMMMPKFVMYKRVILLSEKGYSQNITKKLKNKNYSTLISGLLGEFGTDYFPEGINQRSQLYAIIVKMCDQGDNLDFGKEFNTEYNEEIFKEKLGKGIFTRRNKLDAFLREREKKFNYQTTRNGIRILQSHNRFVECIYENQYQTIVDECDLIDLYIENRLKAIEVVQTRGTNKEKKEFFKLDKVTKGYDEIVKENYNY